MREHVIVAPDDDAMVQLVAVFEARYNRAPTEHERGALSIGYGTGYHDGHGDGYPAGYSDGKADGRRAHGA